MLKGLSDGGMHASALKFFTMILASRDACVVGIGRQHKLIGALQCVYLVVGGQSRRTYLLRQQASGCRGRQRVVSAAAYRQVPNEDRVNAFHHW